MRAFAVQATGGSLLLLPMVWGGGAVAQTADQAAALKAAGSRDLTEIIVTARKREESANDIGMAITAATGDDLQRRGIESVADLQRLVPGLTVQESAYASTSFTLRGVGFFNSDLSTPPAVTVYVDEAPLSYPAMTRLAAFDLERVEVLKGPQGTLYGTNATGGAINYVAAKPSETFRAGAQATYGRFDRVRLGGFVAGPLAEGLGFRLAIQGQRADSWQKSITRPGDRLGRVRELQARGTLEWRSRGGIQSRLTLTLTHDGSDSPAAQFIAPNILIPPLAAPGLASFPVVKAPRAADWAPTRYDNGGPFPYASDSTLHHAAWRTDVPLGEDVTFTSLTSYARFRLRYGQDPDGTPFHIDEVIDRDGKASALFQELRVSGRSGAFTWLAGANLARDRLSDAPRQFFSDVDVGRIFQPLDPLAFADRSFFKGRTRVRTHAVFGRVEYRPGGTLMIEAALRYNQDRRTFDNCGFAESENFTRFWNLFRGGAEPLTRIGDCYVLDVANGFQPVRNVHNALRENSVSWRAGLNWTPRPRLLLYANVSKGYKAGSVPVLAASTTAQFKPVPQESLLAYEAGFKAGLPGRRVQLNASAFYYDYRDKQLRGSMLDPTFGPLEALVSIPKSRVFGAEAQLVARPLPGLTLDASATWVDSKVQRFTGFDALAGFGDQSGTPFPFAPKWQAVTNLDYERAVSSRAKAFVGAGLTYNSRTYAGIGAVDLLGIDAFALVDLRAGVELDEGRLR
ncbi:MAG TPA: TonB-dependent receptor, partial [Allosphingosinicella sp.]